MQHSAQIITRIVGAWLLALVMPCAAQSGTGEKEREIRMLKRELSKTKAQYTVLARDLAASKKREAELRKSVNDLRLRFAALGDNLLNGGEEATLEAVKNAEVLDKRNRATEKAALELMANMREYLRTAVVADPDARVRLESSIRELDAALGLRQKPRPQMPQGSLQHAKVISIDAESGMLVINAGEEQSVRRGMTFSIMRGNRKLAEAIVAETRKDFSGVLPTELETPEDQIRTGDIASVNTVQR
ncbi:hypothetical protein HW115_10885 [Verrucomicrobiaceae bacterium N1E253]|uniref:Uncharacterized protein n=1 Tax=Oceaniferula marina TaxID=2748318 RepID=A0A851GFC6_9BACT|nr:hypothetical protein [Oceaniferula marina]NWK56116.1 hypothetical protein [Oceaniferula marina]